VVGPDVRLVSSAEETARDVYRRLVEHGMLRTTRTRPTRVFEATGDDADEFSRLARRFLGLEAPMAESVLTGSIQLPHLRGTS
jgi:glutamate racemase